jgi:hypothetical protein
MKFLCIPCDAPMKLQTVEPPDRGSLSIVYACPECGYEMAMLTNAYETQVVQSLGVKVGPSTTLGEATTDAAGAKCPFSGMIPGAENSAERGKPDAAIRWTAAAEARLLNVPEFVRPMARVGIEKFALEKGAREVDDEILDAAREFFGM